MATQELTVLEDMLGNIANDLDNLLIDICPSEKPQVPPGDGKQREIFFDSEKTRVVWSSEQQTIAGKSGTLHSGTVDSGDTLGKDSFFSSAGNTSRRHGDGISSNQSLVSLEDRQDCDSVDSGHDGRPRTGPSPLVFEPQHFGSPSQVAEHKPAQHSSPMTSQVSPNMEELRTISTVERLVKTNSIWLLAGLSRAGAVHILKDRDPGTFLVRKSSHGTSLALSVHSGLCGQPTVDHYLIEATNYGFKLQNSIHVFHSVPALIAYYIDHIDEIPYHLSLPGAIQLAKSTRELASLDLLGQDFWMSPISRKSPPPVHCSLHKSCSEPINIQRPIHPTAVSEPSNTVPSKSASDFSHFMRTQAQMEKYFAQAAGSTHTPQTSHGQDVGASASLHSHDVPDCSLVPQSVPEGLPPQSSSSVTVTSNLVKESHSFHDPSIVLSSNTSNQDGVIIENTLLQRLDSDHSWPLASCPLPSSDPTHFKPSNQQSHHIAGSNPQPSDTDIYRSHPTNQPVISITASHSADQPGLTSKSRAWTHPRTEVPKSKSNLYFTTNLGLLEIPENSYFKSNLSDKLSDYEDIWRTSCAESDIERHNLHKLRDPRSVLESKMSRSSGKTRTSKKKVLRKTSKDSPSTRRSNLANRDSVTGGTTGLTALDQARIIAGTMSEDESVDQILAKESAVTTLTTTATITSNAMNLSPSTSHPYRTSRHIQLKTSHSLDLSPPKVQHSQMTSLPLDLSSQTSPKCVFTATMSVIVSEPSESPTTKFVSAVAPGEAIKVKHKALPSPLSRLSRLKSSSESSLATVLSPMDAEPVDTVKLRDKQGKPINIQVRRRSAPIAQGLPKDSKNQTSKVSQNPHLDTIFSPRADTTQSAQTKFSFESPNIKNMSKSAHVTRSQSLRAEASQLERKHSWKDRLNRLKLGTKVLTQNLTPSSAISARKKGPALEELNRAVFTQEHGVQTSPNVPLSPGKFPVPNCQDLVRASCFSESSTIQDLISCSYPELFIKPIASKSKKSDLRNPGRISTPPSEYDNLVIYRASTHSSQGTVYSPPWEGSTANRLIQQQENSPLPVHSPSKLPPTCMDYQERVTRWQEANSTFVEEAILKAAAKGHRSESSSTAATNQNMPSPTAANQSSPDKIQRQQLLHHQHLLKMEEGLNKDTSPRPLVQHRHSTHVSTSTVDGSSMAQNISQHAQKSKHRLSKQDSGTKPLMYPAVSPTSDLSKLSLAATVDTSAASQLISSASKTDTVAATSSSPHRLSSYCPDVVNCHSAGLQEEGPSALEEDDDVMFGGVCQELQDRLKPVLSPQVSSAQQGSKNPGTKIQEYIFKLSADQHTIFGSTIVNFIQCTVDSQESNPQHVLRNVRQFMTGIKNYLVKHGEGELADLIEMECNKLGDNQILNIDAIMEQALHVCVLKPLKYHIYKLFVDKYSTNGALEQLSRNIKYARSRSAQDLGVKPGLTLPGSGDMEVIKHYLDLMQRSYSPLQKLQNLLQATSTIYHCVQGKVHHVPSRGPYSLGADDFLPLLIYVIVHCGLVSAEIEADFMWGLLQPSLLTGEGGYYLTTLSSAVLILKNFEDTHQMVPAQMEARLPSIADMQAFLKIAIPDEIHGEIMWQTLPVRPNMNTRDVCALVAHKFKITNPQDYGLYLLSQGTESQLADTECPQIIKGDNLASGKHCYFVFKRVDANIAWPRHMKHSPLSMEEI